MRNRFCLGAGEINFFTIAVTPFKKKFAPVEPCDFCRLNKKYWSVAYGNQVFSSSGDRFDLSVGLEGR